MLRPERRDGGSRSPTSPATCCESGSTTSAHDFPGRVNLAFDDDPQLRHPAARAVRPRGVDRRGRGGLLRRRRRGRWRSGRAATQGAGSPPGPLHDLARGIGTDGLPISMPAIMMGRRSVGSMIPGRRPASHSPRPRPSAPSASRCCRRTPPPRETECHDAATERRPVAAVRRSTTRAEAVQGHRARSPGPPGRPQGGRRAAAVRGRRAGGAGRAPVSARHRGRAARAGAATSWPTSCRSGSGPQAGGRPPPGRWRPRPAPRPRPSPPAAGSPAGWPTCRACPGSGARPAITTPPIS